MVNNQQTAHNVHLLHGVWSYAKPLYTAAWSKDGDGTWRQRWVSHTVSRRLAEAATGMADFITEGCYSLTMLTKLLEGNLLLEGVIN